MNTNLIEYVTQKLVKKEVSKKFKHVYPVVHNIKIFPFAGTKVLSNSHNNTILSVDICEINSSKSSCAERNIISDQISHSYDCTASYHLDSIILNKQIMYRYYFFYR